MAFQVGKGSNVGINAIMNGCVFNYNITGMRISYGYGSDGYFKFGELNSAFTIKGMNQNRYTLVTFDSNSLKSDQIFCPYCDSAIRISDCELIKHS